MFDTPRTEVDDHENGLVGKVVNRSEYASLEISSSRRCSVGHVAVGVAVGSTSSIFWTA